MPIRLSIVTHHPIWVSNTGTRNRLLSLYRTIAADPRFSVEIGYLRYLNETDKEVLAKTGLKAVSIPSLQEPKVKYKTFDFSYYRHFPDLRRFFNVPSWHGFQEYVKDNIDVYMFTFIGHMYLSKQLAGKIVAIDTNDLNSIRASIFNFQKRPMPVNISYAGEMVLLNDADLVLAIQDDEYAMACAGVPNAKVMYVPHALRPRYWGPTPKQEIDKKCRGEAPLQVLFAASHQSPNVDGLKWFLSNVWLYLPKRKFELNVCGSICEVPEIKELIGRKAISNVRSLGLVDDLDAQYTDADLVVNPCPYGSGMKVKTVEALSFGRPLVTTSAGAEGLRKGAGRSFLVADTARDFICAMLCMMESENRSMLSKSALQFTSEYFLGDHYTRMMCDRIFSQCKFRIV